MILKIVALDSSNDLRTSGDLSFTEALIRQQGHFAFENTILRGVTTDAGGNPIDYWDVYRSASFTTNGFSMGEVTFSFDLLVVERSEQVRVFANPAPLGNLTLSTAIRQSLLQLQYDYSGSVWGDAFDFSGSEGGTARGGAGSDRLKGSKGDDKLYGGTGDDELDGNGGNDLVDGGDGDDYIVGSLGQRLIGGAGIDFLKLDLSPISSNLIFRALALQKDGAWLTSNTWLHGFENYDLKLGAGDDTIDLSGLGALYSPRSTNLDAGAGNDTLKLDSETHIEIASVRNVEWLEVDYRTKGSWDGISMRVEGKNIVFDGAVFQGLRSIKLDGGSDSDQIVGTAGNDSLSGGGGDDRIEGRGGKDKIDGGDGHDTIVGSLGSQMSGGSGLDTLEFDRSGIAASLHLKFTAQLKNWLEIAPDTTIRGFERMKLRLGDGDDTIDLSDAKSGGGTYFGGNGYDTLQLNSSSLRPTEQYYGDSLHIYNFERIYIDYSDKKHEIITDKRGLVTSPIQVEAGSFWLEIGTYETLTFKLGTANDVFFGSASNDIIYGNKGNDTITGGGGKDRIYGGDGKDLITGMLGSIYSGGAARDSLTIDHSLSRTGDRFVVVKQKGETFYLDDETSISGFETVDMKFGRGDDSVDISGLNFSAPESENNISFRGSKGKDIITLNQATRGQFYVPEFEIAVLDWSGSKLGATLKLAIGSYVQTVTSSKLHLMLGKDVAVKFSGSDFKDSINGGKNSDILSGRAGDDFLRGGRGNDVLKGGAGNDALMGDGGHDTLNGGAGDDVLTGGGGRDRLIGSAGDDTLIGGEGADVLTGGSGKDLFVFKSTGDSFGSSFESGLDRITDFKSGKDGIDLSAIDADQIKRGAQAFSFIDKQGSVFTGKAGELVFRKIAGGIMVHGDTNGDAIADFSLMLSKLSTLHEGDFIL